MTFEVGKRVVAESESADRPHRTGTIAEVLKGDPSPRYRIRWDDGHETIYTPAAGALRSGRRGSSAKTPASAGRSSRISDAQAKPEPDEPPHYYRDEKEHIHLLE